MIIDNYKEPVYDATRHYIEQVANAWYITGNSKMYALYNAAMVYKAALRDYDIPNIDDPHVNSLEPGFISGSFWGHGYNGPDAIDILPPVILPAALCISDL